MFSLFAVAFVFVLFGVVGVQTSSAQSFYSNNGSGSYGSPVCGYGGCAGYNYSVAMYPYTPVASAASVPTAYYAGITGCGEQGCNAVWGTVSPQSNYYNPMVYYNPRPVYPSYYGW